MYSLDQDRPRFSVMVIDIDRFKSINDGHGHAAGDEFLKLLSGTARDICADKICLPGWVATSSACSCPRDGGSTGSQVR